MPFLSVTSYFSIFFIPLFGIPIFNNSNKFKNEDFSEDQNLPNFPKQSKFQKKKESFNLTIISIEDISFDTKEIQKCKNSEQFPKNNIKQNNYPNEVFLNNQNQQFQNITINHNLDKISETCIPAEEFDDNNVNFNLSLFKIKQVESFYIDGKINENETDITNK